MNKTYFLKEAFTLNATGLKVNAIATPASMEEVKAQKLNFDFNFYNMAHDVIIYKFTAQNAPLIIQGLVAFKPSPGVLDCINMETNIHNRKPAPIFGNVGKAMVALCCKFSIDNGMDGYITFESKGKLKPYYQRLGAISITNTKMYLNTTAAQKLVDLYF